MKKKTKSEVNQLLYEKLVFSFLGLLEGNTRIIDSYMLNLHWWEMAKKKIGNTPHKGKSVWKQRCTQ